MCHADSLVMPYFRLISHAETLFFDAANSKITSTHVRTLIFDPCMIVLVRTENCFRQPFSRHFHTRRSVGCPVRVFRLTPFAGRRK